MIKQLLIEIEMAGSHAFDSKTTKCGWVFDGHAINQVLLSDSAW